MDQNKKADDCVANGSITIAVPNLDTLFNEVRGKAQEIASTVEKIGGLKWQMKVRKVLRPTRLNMYVYCNEQVKDRLWLCKVQFTMKMWSTGEEDKPFYSISGHYYGFNSHFWIFPVNYYHHYHSLKKRPFEVKLEIKLVQVQEKSLPTLDTSLVVNMGEGHSETLFVNKHILAGLSSYFRNLFFEDWRDKREHEGNFFELNEPEDFDIRAFKAMIYSAMTLGSCWMVQESKFLDCELAVEIIKQSIKFDMAMLLDCCEQYLIGVKDYSQFQSAMKLLEFADKFNLAQLTEHCLKRVSISDFATKNLQICFLYSTRMRMEEEIKKNKQIYSRLSKATQEKFLAKLDGEKDFKGCSKMEVQEMADQFNLVQLKEHSLKELKLIDFMRDFSTNKQIYSRLSKATQEKLLSKLDGEKVVKGHSKMFVLEMAEHFELVKLKEHCLKNIHVGDFLQNFNENKKTFSCLSKATQEKLLAKLDEKIDLNVCPHTKMAVLEVADQFNLIKLRQHCLDEMNLLDFMKNIAKSVEIFSSLSKDTQQQLQEKLGGKAEELRDLTEQLKSGVESNKTKRVLVEHINKLSESVLGHEEEGASDSSDSE